MRNIKLTIEYDGTCYRGWQKLTNSEKTIQGKLENVLSKMTNEEISLIGSGRTDSGVHAKKQTANFKTNCTMSLKNIIDYCNNFLPKDIVIKSAEDVAESFHSRYNAKRKIYEYNICNGTTNDVFKRNYSFYIEKQLNVELMREASLLFIGEHDFRAFSSIKNKNKSTVRTIYSIIIDQCNDKIKISFDGNGFLYNMVRILAGTLIEVGLGNMTKNEIIPIFNSKIRSCAGFTAPSQGLFLMDVIY